MIGLSITTKPTPEHYAAFQATARLDRFSVTQFGSTEDEAKQRAKSELLSMLAALGRVPDVTATAE